MLRTTKKEREHVESYVRNQLPTHGLELAQKVYSERVHAECHDIWDVHTKRSRWWVITNPTNLYSQKQFPNMDLALTFHVGLCLRIPNDERKALNDLAIEPLAACWRTLQEANESLRRAEEAEDFQTIGMRSREALLNLIHVAQECVPMPNGQEKPKKSDFRGWLEIVSNAALPGPNQQERRSLVKAGGENAWKFTNWLTHAKDSHFADAEAALAITELAISLLTSALIRTVRGVPDRCPSCGSQKLSPERGIHTSAPETTYERPVCDKCGWMGEPVAIEPVPANRHRKVPDTECVIMSKPLRKYTRLK
jgi:predicted RNA-binding Zn-ribbon protein involved in translation (DUF1610 family)